MSAADAKTVSPSPQPPRQQMQPQNGMISKRSFANTTTATIPTKNNLTAVNSLGHFVPGVHLHTNGVIPACRPAITTPAARSTGVSVTSHSHSQSSSSTSTANGVSTSSSSVQLTINSSSSQLSNPVNGNSTTTVTKNVVQQERVHSDSANNNDAPHSPMARNNTRDRNTNQNRDRDSGRSREREYRTEWNRDRRQIQKRPSYQSYDKSRRSPPTNQVLAKSVRLKKSNYQFASCCVVAAAQTQQLCTRGIRAIVRGILIGRQMCTPRRRPVPRPLRRLGLPVPLNLLHRRRL